MAPETILFGAAKHRITACRVLCIVFTILVGGLTILLPKGVPNLEGSRKALAEEVARPPSGGSVEVHRLGEGGQRERIEKGRRLVRKFGCRGCHTIEGYGQSHAPILDGSNQRFRTGWIERYLQRPYRMRPFNGDLEMPRFTSPKAHQRISETEIQLIGDFIQALTGPGGTIPKGQREDFQKRPCYSCHAKEYRKRIGPYRRTRVPTDLQKAIDSHTSLILCMSCHILGDLGRKVVRPSTRSTYRMAPDLIHVARKNGLEWIIQYVKKEEDLSRRGSMPNLSLPDRVWKNIHQSLTILQDRIDSKDKDRLEIIENPYGRR